MFSSSINVLGYQVFIDDINKINPKEKLIINTLNGHSYSVAKKDHLFYEALHSSDILLPDGASVTLSAKFDKGIKIRKIAGYDIFKYLLIQLNSENGSCFFLGSIPETLALIKERLTKEYPNINAASYSPPFVKNFSTEQSEIMCQLINEFKPDVLFVGMTAPKQEKWVYKHKSCINANIICSIGAVFDFYAGTKTRPSRWLINSNLEWFGRFIKEPKRMFYRYFISTPSIFIDLILYKTHIKTPYTSTKRISNPSIKEVDHIKDLDYEFHYKVLEERSPRKTSDHDIQESHNNKL